MPSVWPRVEHNCPISTCRMLTGVMVRGPCSALACDLCAGVAAAEVLKILLGRKPLRAPGYAQFDAYRRLFREGRHRAGNRHPVQRLRRYVLRRRLLQLGYGGD